MESLVFYVEYAPFHVESLAFYVEYALFHVESLAFYVEYVPFHVESVAFYIESVLFYMESGDSLTECDVLCMRGLRKPMVAEKRKKGSLMMVRTCKAF
jgi:hypothetical protein